MGFAPIGIGAAIAVTVGKSGLGVFKYLGLLVLTLYGALAVFIICVLVPVALIAKVPLKRFIKTVKEPALIAFSTASSEAALPRAMEVMEQFGVPRRIVAFVMPTGYSFNLDGSTLYLAVASVFVAQAAGIDMSLEQSADHDAHADAHVERRRRGAARVTRDPLRRARDVRTSARRVSP